MLQDTFTNRPRSGYTNTLAVNATTTIAVPAGMRKVTIAATGAGVGVNMNGSATPPAPQAAGVVGPFAHIAPGILHQFSISPGTDSHIHIRSGGTAPTVFIGFYI